MDVFCKQCKNCGRFFIPSGKSDSEYCDRIDAASGKTCKEVGAINTFAKKHENDEIHQAYTKAYRRMDSRKHTMYISKKEFTEWSKEARENVNYVRKVKSVWWNFKIGLMRASAGKSPLCFLNFKIGDHFEVKEKWCRLSLIT